VPGPLLIDPLPDAPLPALPEGPPAESELFDDPPPDPPPAIAVGDAFSSTVFPFSYFVKTHESACGLLTDFAVA